MPLKSYLLPAAILALLALGRGALCAPPAIRLRVKAYTQPVEFLIHDSHAKMKLDPRQIVPTEKMDSVEHTRQVASGTTDAGIQFTVERLKRDLYVNGEVVTTKLVAPSTFTYMVTPRGETIEDTPSDPIGRALTPVFPEQDIAPGFSWTTTLPPSKALPCELKVTHAFAEVGDVDGIPSATFITKGQARGVEPRTGSKILVDVKGKAVYAVADGAVVKASTEIQFQMVEPKAGVKFVPFHQTTWRTVRRWAAVNQGAQ